jgi:peptide/nickel transport system permease protein
MEQSAPAAARNGARVRPRTFLAHLPLLLLVLVALVGPEVVPHDPVRVSGGPSVRPGAEHWFGTDSTGLDVFSRTVAAARTNLVIAALVAAIATVGGILAGLVVGLNEGKRGLVGLLARGGARVFDLVDAVPAVIVGLVVVALFGASELSLVLALGVILIPNQARLTRTEVLRVRGEAFVDAGEVSGLGRLEIAVRHIVPNASQPALENVSLVFGTGIVISAALGFLGVGLPLPTAEWGVMISSGAADLGMGRWWAALFPMLALVYAVTSVALAGGATIRAIRG